MDFKDSWGAERECEGVLLLANEIPPNVQKQQIPPGCGGGREKRDVEVKRARTDLEGVYERGSSP